MTEAKQKTLGEAIDGLVAALAGLDQATQLTALRAVCEHEGLALPAAAPVAPSPGTSSLLPTSTGHPSDIRSLKESKAPASAVEMACVVAYYLQELAPQAERLAAVASSDLEKHFRQAGYPLPTAMKQLPLNVKAAGYFDGKGSGRYALNAVGYNLVVHTLPRKTQGEGGAPARRRTSTRTRAKKPVARRR